MQNSKLYSVTGLLIAIHLLPTPASAEVVTGVSESYQTLAPFAITNQAPLLQGFNFSFLDTDHHLKQIVLRPNGSSGSLLPGKLELSYADKWGFADYYYRAEYTVGKNMVPTRSTGHQYCVDTCSVILPNFPGRDSHVFVLVGFAFEFDRDSVLTDHHVKQFEIKESNGRLTVNYRDQEGPDVFDWEVMYAWVPRDNFAYVQNSRSGTATGSAHQSISSVGRPVIHGFNLNFRYTDHHIKNIAVELTPGALDVDFADKNGDDRFDYFVSFGALN